MKVIQEYDNHSMYVHCMSYNRRSTGTDSVTGFAQRDHILHFEMCVIQRSIFRQWYANSVSNMGIYRGDGAAAMMKKWSLNDCTIWELWDWFTGFAIMVTFSKNGTTTKALISGRERT